MLRNFTIAASAAAIAYFVAAVSTLLHRRERGPAASGQNAPGSGNDYDYLVRMGALAAGAAHELRSPLTTMAVLVEEMRREQDAGERRNCAEDLRIVSDQIQACREILCDLLAYGQDARVNDRRIKPVDRFLDETVAKWRRLRPGVRLEILRAGMYPAPGISAEGSLAQAILSLLNNAADASPQAVEMECRCDSGNLRILIQDRGPGIPPELAHMPGKPFFTTKHDAGTGIGLLLAKMAVDRAGGSLKLSNRPGGGTHAEMILPLEADRQCEQAGAGNDGADSREKVHYRSAATPTDAGSEALRIADLPAQLTPTRSHLRQLLIARNAVLLAGAVGVAGMAAVESALRSPGIAGVLGILALLNFFTWLRLRQPAPVSYGQFLLQILADVVLLSAALCLSGGDASPFNDLYFVPLTIAAATLPWRHTLIAALAIVGCRELACHYYLPLPVLRAPDHEMVELLTGGLIAYFAFSMARTSRRHEEILARIREDYLKQRHSTELGTMAAMTADRMSSPLATMAVVVGELREGAGHSSEYQQALDIIASRIELCKQILSRLLASAGFGRVESGGKMPADKFLATIADKCQLVQPWMALRCHCEGGLPAPAMLAETSLEQAILVLLKSAPGAIPMEVEISGQWDARRLQILIRTRGSLPAPDADVQPGVPLFARKTIAADDRQELFMAKATIGRFGGTIDEATQAGGHACLKLSLPLSDVAA